MDIATVLARASRAWGLSIRSSIENVNDWALKDKSVGYECRYLLYYKDAVA